MSKRLIPKCMSTQHPDNVNSPFFAETKELGGEDEIQEAYYAFSHLGCQEQMWDCEGKEVDSFVVKKLLTKYESFFREHRLGEDVFITLRVPNPTVEKAEAKVLLETLESIPRSFDAAKLFYGEDTPAIFEVILPMTGSHKCLDRIYRYYADFVAGKESTRFKDGDITIGEWIGEFKPKNINVIPLFEDMEHVLEASEITRKYLAGKEIAEQRVFLARSDPAMNYGLVSAVLLNKIALQDFHELSEDTGVAIHPIIGVGSAPFRGNLKPLNTTNVMLEYPSAATLTIQSAFKYDHNPSEVAQAIVSLNARTIRRPHEVDRQRCLDIIKKYSAEYEAQLKTLAATINMVARFVPVRRKRKLHIGLFGYARNLKGLTLPRVISFTCSMYSIGVPPEILALNALDDGDIAWLSSTYLNFDNDLRDALRFWDPDSDFTPKALKARVGELFPSVEPDEDHLAATREITDAVKTGASTDISAPLIRAASLRRFLG